MASYTPPPLSKKVKISIEDENEDENEPQQYNVIDKVWDHYRNFLDSIDQDDDDDGGGGGPDCDELYELIDISKNHKVVKPTTPIVDDYEDDDDDDIDNSDPDEARTMRINNTLWRRRIEMLPVLLSVSYCHLAEDAISQYLLSKHQSNKENDDDNNQIRNIQTLLTESLEWFDHNALTWSIGANFGRISQTLSLNTTLQWYERAVHSSMLLRNCAIRILSKDVHVDAIMKEWIEILILNQMAGVEYQDIEEEEEDKGDHKDTFQNEYEVKNHEQCDEGEAEEMKPKETFENEFSEKGCQDDEENDEEDTESERPGRYSSSVVESTARFMCSMLLSMEGEHDEALEHLKHFPLTHRLHPNLWKDKKNETIKLEESLSELLSGEHPVVFEPSMGVLPPHLYNAMKELFAPESSFWMESDYANRGYYSFFMDYNENKKQPDNLLEDIIVNHLLPRTQYVLNRMDHGKNNTQPPKIVGFEWWAHTRPIQANLGHNLHFDTDESLLDQEGKVTHPILSSVLYLTGGRSASTDTVSPSGSTIILDQTPDSTEDAKKCWKTNQEDNSFLLFPGNRLHGVLPCTGNLNNADAESEKKKLSIKELRHAWKDTVDTGNDTKSSSSDMVEHRLTFMVGFWTRNVPATMKKRRLYGPCGPLPPRTEEHSWVNEIMKGYENDGTNEIRKSHNENTTENIAMEASILPPTSPAWEVIKSNCDMDPKQSNNDDDDDKSPPLCIPHGIDHRFFVNGAPEFFRQSLFEDREIDKC